jgi:hypothetical protein
MKKFTISFILLFTLSLTTFAEGEIHTGGFTDGEIHTGGKSCPQNQTCLVESNQTETDNPIISAVKNFLNLLF